MTPETFSAAMLVLGETFNEPVSDVRMEAYADALGDLEPGSVLAAMKACVRECQFFPRPAEIRQRVLGSTDDRAEVAWGQLTEAVRRIGYTGWPGHLDIETMDTVKALWGSWARLCETLPGEGPELLGWRKAFVASFGSQERQTARAQLGAGELKTFAQLAPNVRRIVQASADPEWWKAKP